MMAAVLGTAVFLCARAGMALTAAWGGGRDRSLGP